MTTVSDEAATNDPIAYATAAAISWNTWRYVLGPIASLAWLGTAWQPFGVVFLLNYTFLALAAISFAPNLWAIVKRIPRTNFINERAVTIAAVVVPLLVNAYFDRYTRTVFENDGLEREASYYRWSRRPYYLSVSTPWQPDSKERWSAEGPLTPSGKKHGEWTYLEMKPNMVYEKKWYWYGDEVPEGEFELRRRGVSR